MVSAVYQETVGAPIDLVGNSYLACFPLTISGGIGTTEASAFQTGSVEFLQAFPSHPYNEYNTNNSPVGLLRLSVCGQAGGYSQGMQNYNPVSIPNNDQAVADQYVDGILPPSPTIPGSSPTQWPSNYVLNSGNNGWEVGEIATIQPQNIYTGGISIVPLILEIPLSFQYGNNLQGLLSQAGYDWQLFTTVGSSSSTCVVTIPNVPVIYDYNPSNNSLSGMYSVMIDPTDGQTSLPNYPWSSNSGLNNQNYCNLIVVTELFSSGSSIDANKILVNVVVNFPQAQGLPFFSPIIISGSGYLSNNTNQFGVIVTGSNVAYSNYGYEGSFDYCAASNAQITSNVYSNFELNYGGIFSSMEIQYPSSPTPGVTPNIYNGSSGLSPSQIGIIVGTAPADAIALSATVASSVIIARGAYAAITLNTDLAGVPGGFAARFGYFCRGINQAFRQLFNVSNNSTSIFSSIAAKFKGFFGQGNLMASDRFAPEISGSNIVGSGADQELATMIESAESDATIASTAAEVVGVETAAAGGESVGVEVGVAIIDAIGGAD